jgi:drug/metabolite transporter superfamily protein YnfA
MRVDSQRVLLIGTGMWLVALIVLLPFWSWLGRHDHRSWLWTCVAGVVLGLIGILLVRKHRSEGRTG